MGLDVTKRAKKQHYSFLLRFYLKSNLNCQSYKRGEDICIILLSHNILKQKTTTASRSVIHISDEIH